MKHTLTKTKTCLVLFAALWRLTLSTPLEAADFLFSWKASSDASITAYRVYQRTGDSPYTMIDEVQVEDLDNPTISMILANYLKT